MAEEKPVSSMTLVELGDELDELNRRGPGQITPRKGEVSGELEKRLNAQPSSLTEAQILEQMDYRLSQGQRTDAPTYRRLSEEFDRRQLQSQTQAAQKTAEYTRRTATWMLVAGIAAAVSAAATAISAVFSGVTTWMSLPKQGPSKIAETPSKPDAGKAGHQ